MKTVLFIIENESSKCCLTCCENRKSKPCFVLEISPGVYRVLFSTSVEHRVKMLVDSSQKVMILPTNRFSKFLAKNIEYGKFSGF